MVTGDIPSNASPQQQAALRRTRSVARILDQSVRVPGTNFRFGLDPIVGILPVSGDTATAVLSLYIVFEAARSGVPPKTLAMMCLNIVIDVVGGSIPILGTVFDATWKANVRNVALFEEQIEKGE
ncbi:DUF4112 domain-containing protein [Halocatena salina]|uniref:DUF4112 domain-containing protein n=1 Tax=Halocatena salina TaxID=2934340 RepID=A0A8U0A8B2_9EURY|nr:DUF4112 domain-containing protein [Halocatena salina]UPM45076.1 DUF4112 domain-containing protein [Halocatena salina]